MENEYQLIAVLKGKEGWQRELGDGHAIFVDGGERRQGEAGRHSREFMSKNQGLGICFMEELEDDLATWQANAEQLRHKACSAHTIDMKDILIMHA